MPDPLTTVPAPAPTVQGSAPASAAPPPQNQPQVPAPQPSGLDAYDLGDTRIQIDDAVATVTGSAPAPTPRDPASGRFTKPDDSPPEIPAASPQMSQYLIGLAKDMGFSDEEIKGSTPQQLERDIYVINRRLRSETKADARLELLDGGGRSPAGERTTTPQPATPAQEPEWYEYEEDDPEKPGTKIRRSMAEEIHPAIVKMLDRLHKQNKELVETVKHLSAAEQGRQAEAFYSEIDRLFVSRPDIFGDKPAPQMKPEEPHFQKRGAIVRLMKTFEKGNMQERWDRAVKMVYGDAAPAKPAPAPTPPPTPPPQQNGSRISQETWDKAGLAAPTHRNGASEPTGVEKATKTLQAKLREFEVADDEQADKDFRP